MKQAIAIALGLIIAAVVLAQSGEPVLTTANPNKVQPVNVTNFPDPQNVTGTVDVGNLPASQSVTGAVDVGNLPLDSEGYLILSRQPLPPAQEVLQTFDFVTSDELADTFFQDNIWRTVWDSPVLDLDTQTFNEMTATGEASMLIDGGLIGSLTFNCATLFEWPSGSGKFYRAESQDLVIASTFAPSAPTGWDPLSDYPAFPSFNEIPGARVKFRCISVVSSGTQHNCGQGCTVQVGPTSDVSATVHSATMHLRRRVIQ